MDNSIFFVIGMLVGMIIGISVVAASNHSFVIKNWYKKLTLKPTVGQMYGSYSVYYPENYLVEEYNSLYEITQVGDVYVRLKLIDDRNLHTSSNKIVDVKIVDLPIRYFRYKGTKDKKKVFDDLLDE